MAVKRTDLDLLTDESAKQLAIADNRASELSLDWNPDVLKALSEEVDLTGLFSDEELAAILASGASAELLTDEDEVPDPPKVAKTKLGDLYLLGPHRLLCGDATSAGDVARLMGGTSADCVWTDPPYNVAYQTKLSKDEAVARNRRTDGLEVMNDAMTPAAFIEFLVKALGNACKSTISGGAIYIAHADANGLAFRESFIASGWSLRQCLIWNKQIFVMGRQDYHWKHEPILYGWKEGAAHHWYADRSQTTVDEAGGAGRVLHRQQQRSRQYDSRSFRWVWHNADRLREDQSPVPHDGTGPNLRRRHRRTLAERYRKEGNPRWKGQQTSQQTSRVVTPSSRQR